MGEVFDGHFFGATGCKQAGWVAEAVRGPAAPYMSQAGGQCQTRGCASAGWLPGMCAERRSARVRVCAGRAAPDPRLCLCRLAAAKPGRAAIGPSACLRGQSSSRPEAVPL